MRRSLPAACEGVMSADAGTGGGRLTVNEIFHSIQGEATHAGRPCTFVRLTACDLRCRWCDTEYAFHEGESMSLDAVRGKVAELGCPLVEVTGGEPLLQPGTAPLVRALLDDGYEVLVETGGHLDTAVLDRRARVILDLKCPGSGESGRNCWANVERLEREDSVKFVIADREDYEWSRQVVDRHDLANRCEVYLSPVHGELPASQLAAWMLEDRISARLQVQLHKILWGADRRGV
jgi:7-carboxy-7-deazaguanine synthase